jgi:uncharacterized damage-inducible protein DinB
MLRTVSGVIDYYEGIRRRTLNFVRMVPGGKVEWAPAPGEFTCGGLVRHVTAAETMFVGAVVEGRWTYAGHEANGAESVEELVERLTEGHVAAMNRLRTVDDSELVAERPTLNGPPVKAWRLLMAMVEHEVHHRSQLAMYLMLNGVKPPHIYGLGVEDVIARATG